MRHPTFAIAVIVVAVVAAATGIGYARAARAWKDYRSTKTSLPGLLRAAWTLTGRAIVIGAAAAIAVGAGLYTSGR